MNLRGWHIYEDNGSWWLDVEHEAERAETLCGDHVVKQEITTVNTRLQICTKLNGKTKFFGGDLCSLYLILNYVRSIRGF